MATEAVADATDAVRLAVTVADEADLVLVTGTFYVLSSAREALTALGGSSPVGDFGELET